MKETKNKIKNAKDKFAGEVKVAVGKATNNKEMEIEGKIQSTSSDIKTKIGKMKSSFKKK